MTLRVFVKSTRILKINDQKQQKAAIAEGDIMIIQLSIPLLAKRLLKVEQLIYVKNVEVGGVVSVSQNLTLS